MPRRRSVGDGRFDGIIGVDKPAGPTSHDIVALVRRLTGVQRVGHGGTLDPFAAGILPVFVGRATRLVEYHMGDDKSYRAVVAFGARSTTDDIDGELVPAERPPPTREQVERALDGFRGTIEQLPPMHSAVHVGGRRAYEIARTGETPAVKPRTVEIQRLELVDWQDDPERPTTTLELTCTAGTYVRSIARDLGQVLGSGGYLAALVRTRSGPFRLDQAHALDEVRSALAAGRPESVLLPPDAGLDDFPRIQPTPEDLAALQRGQLIRWRERIEPRPGPQGYVRVADESGRLVAIARFVGGRLQPEKVLRSVDELPTPASVGAAT